MAKCKDCLHYEVCDKNPTLTEFSGENEAYCEAFKDRSKWVEQKHGRCKWCSGDYHTTILATAIRHHSNGNMDGYELKVSFCPNCGADMRERREGE